jgi:hypothetical protein
MKTIFVDDLLDVRKLNAPLSNSIFNEFSKLLELVQKIPKSKRKTKNLEMSGESVSVSNIIAYQIGWGNLLIGWYNAGLKGKIPEMPGEGFCSWNYVELAKHFYKKYDFDHGKIQEQEFATVVMNILNISEIESKRGNLDKLNVWSWCTLGSGKSWPLNKWIQVNTVAPYKRASSILRKFIKKVNKV